MRLKSEAKGQYYGSFKSEEHGNIAGGRAAWYVTLVRTDCLQNVY